MRVRETEMTMQVLQRKAQISESREELDRRGLSALDSSLRRMLSRVGLRSAPALGDRVKSWDVLNSIRFIEQNVPRDGAILDIGAYGSEILSILRRLKYRNLTGADLNPLVKDSPYADEIRYEVCDFLRTPFADGTFHAITAISVIEHGFQKERLLQQVSRLLKSGGYFVASFDYWPEKIDTKGQRFFGLDWLIFSEPDIQELVAAASSYALTPCGPMSFDASERTIDCAKQRYTFGWLVLQKT